MSIPVSHTEFLSQSSDAGGSSPDVCDVPCTTWKTLEHVEQLLPQRKSIKRSMHAPRDLFNLSLPVEIISEIFILSYWNLTRVSINHMQFAIGLSLVCHHWRDVAIRIPQLWSTVVISTDSSYKTSPQRDIRLLEGLLCRSKLLPLSLHLTLKSDTPWSTDRRVMGPAFLVIDQLRVHCGRWKNVTINKLCNAYLVFRLFKDIGSEVDVIVNGWDAIRIRREGDIATDEIFCPKSLRLEGATGTTGLPFSWTQLTHLVLCHALYFDEHINIIRLAPNLVSLHRENGDHGYSGIFDLPPINQHVTHSSLICLRTRESCFISWTDILDFVTLPALETFHYEYRHQSDHFEQLDHFFDRSSPPIKEFSFCVRPSDSQWCSNNNLWYSDAGRVAITTLELDTSELIMREPRRRMTYNFLSLLAAGFRGGQLPKLRHLVLHDIHISSDFWSSFSNVFLGPKAEYGQSSSSLDNIKSLKTVEIYLHEDWNRDNALQVGIDDSLLARLEEISISGVQITLRHGARQHMFSSFLNAFNQ